jgi:hypothetical protein
VKSSFRRWAAGAALSAGLIVGLAPPASAQYTKLYQFKNTTGLYEPSARVILNGLEAITTQYAIPTDWVPAAVGSTVSGGVYCTTLTFTGYAVPPGNNARIGWSTADNKCRLRDLRWSDGLSIVPTLLGGVPGGGLVFYDYPEPGDLTVVITNDNDGSGLCINLADIGFAISGVELNLEELSALTDSGLVELHVANIDEDIDVLRGEVAYYGSTGILPSPSANSLIRKLDKAAALKDAGLSAYLAGNLSSALSSWAKAADQMQGFVKQVTDSSLSGNLSQTLYDRWIVDGDDGEITTAPQIVEALRALPEGTPLQNLSPLPEGTLLPSYAGLEESEYQPWPVTVLCPGEYTVFVVHNVNFGAGFIMGGSVVDTAGTIVLNWIEQAGAEPTVIDNERPWIESASATPANLWPPDHQMIQMTLNVEVRDNVYAIWYIEGVSSNQPELGTGDGDYAPDWWVDPANPQSLWLREERSGNHPEATREYTIALRAIDAAGNLSEEPYLLTVRVYHDES